MSFTVTSSLFGFLLLIMLYIWSFMSLKRKWSTMSGFWQIVYVLLLCTGAGPIPVLIMLYFNVGVDSFHQHPIYTQTVYVEQSSDY